MPKAKNVTVIPATLNIHTKTPTKERVRRRVAAYARVSTDSEEQLTSYEAQVDYYTRFIQENPDWDFVEVYTDEGISAVNTKRRDGFNRMIRDALGWKNRPDCDQECEPIRAKYRGQPDHHPQVEGGRL